MPTITVNGTTVPIAINGHARVSHSLGAHLFEEENETYSLVISNGWVGHPDAIGGMFYDAIRLDMGFTIVGVPRICHGYGGSEGRVVVGTENGVMHNYIAPRQVHVVRFAKRVTGKMDEWKRVYERAFRRGTSPFVAAPDALAYLKDDYDEAGLERLAHMRTIGTFGPYHPEGGERGDDPGGTDIDGTPGWDRSPLYRMTRMDMRMDRTPVALIDSATGEPVIAQRGEYFGTRSWNKSGVLPEFVMGRSLTPYDDDRIPRDVNSGSCSYRKWFVPEQLPDGSWTYPYEADNTEHLCRATAHLKACRDLYRDKAAALCLRMVAADAWAAWKPQAVRKGMGLDGPLRSTAWTLDALVAAGYKDQAALIVRNLNSAQMPCGAWQRVTSNREPEYGHSPSPWRDEGMPYDTDATSSKENAYTALAMAQAGLFISAEAAMSGITFHGDPQIWQGCMRGPAPFPYCENASGPKAHWEMWQCWGAIGVLARRYPSHWLRAARRLTLPNGEKFTDIASAVRAGYPEGLAALVEAMEKVV